MSEKHFAFSLRFISRYFHFLAGVIRFGLYVLSQWQKCLCNKGYWFLCVDFTSSSYSKLSWVLISLVECFGFTILRAVCKQGKFDVLLYNLYGFDYVSCPVSHQDFSSSQLRHPYLVSDERQNAPNVSQSCKIPAGRFSYITLLF